MRTHELVSVRGPQRASALQSKEPDAGVFGARVHEDVQVDLLEQVVVVHGASERHETGGHDVLGPLAARGDAPRDLGDQRRHDLLQLVFAPKSCNAAINCRS